MTANWKISDPLPAGNSAREPRVAKLVALEISCVGGRRTKVVVRNLSPYGMGIRADIELLPCENVVVHLPGGRDVAAIIRWARKKSFGLSLEERIEPAMLKPGAADGPIVTKDAGPGFHRMKHQPTTARSGFRRTHRDEVLNSSNWRGGG